MSDAAQAVQHFADQLNAIVESSAQRIKGQYEGWQFDLYQHHNGDWTASLRSKGLRFEGTGGGKLDALADLEAKLSR